MLLRLCRNPERSFAGHLVGPYASPFALLFEVGDTLVTGPVTVLSALTPNDCVSENAEFQDLLPAAPFTGQLSFSIPAPEPVYTTAASGPP